MIIHEKYIQQLEEKEDYLALKNVEDFTTKELTFLVPNDYFRNDIIKLHLKSYSSKDIIRAIINEMVDDAFNEMAFVCLFKVSIMILKNNNHVSIEIYEDDVLKQEEILPNHTHFIGIISPR